MFGSSVDARQLDFLEQLPDDQAWSAVLLLCGNLGLAGGWENTRRLLRRLAQITSSDAVIIADTVDPTIGEDDDAREYQARRIAAGQHVGEVGLRLKYGAHMSPWWRQINFLRGDPPRLIADTGWRLDDHHVDGMDHYLWLTKV